MNKKLNKQNGITLIALIITIIVMLILVGVTISMAVNGGLFGYAGKAAKDTEEAKRKEQELGTGKIEVGGILYNSIENYLKDNPAPVHNWTRGEGENRDKFTCSHCNKTYQMGDTVDFGETTLGTTEYDESKFISKSPTSTETLTTEKYDVTGEEVTSWVVLGIEDTDEDNINETLLVTTSNPVKLKKVINGNVGEDAFGVTMQGAAAYNNAASYKDENGKKVEGELERICKEIYSNTYGKARSMTIEDVNSALQFTPLGGMYYNDTTSTYATTENLTTKLKNLPEGTWNKIKNTGTYTPDGANTEAALGEYELNGYFYGLADDTHLTNIVNDTLTEVTSTEVDTIFGSSENVFNYWLTSRGVVVGGNSSGACAFFGPGRVVEGGADSCNDTFDSFGDVGAHELALRPVVSLRSELPESSR